MLDKTLNFYKQNNQKLIVQYDSVSFELVHKDWLEFLPNKGALVADIGAGSGRDVLWLSNQGYKTIAVEPVVEFYEKFKLKHKNSKVKWLIDSLPKLIKLKKYQNQISLILVSAVWMHLPTQERKDSLSTFSKLNKKNGLLVITLRHGKSPDKRIMYSVSIDEIKTLADQNNYQIKAIKKSDDQLNRTEVFWETIILEKCNVMKKKNSLNAKSQF